MFIWQSQAQPAAVVQGVEPSTPLPEVISAIEWMVGFDESYKIEHSRCNSNLQLTFVRMFPAKKLPIAIRVITGLKEGGWMRWCGSYQLYGQAQKKLITGRFATAIEFDASYQVKLTVVGRAARKSDLERNIPRYTFFVKDTFYRV